LEIENEKIENCLFLDLGFEMDLRMIFLDDLKLYSQKAYKKLKTDKLLMQSRQKMTKLF
jgi:hypothetical protein